MKQFVPMVALLALLGCSLVEPRAWDSPEPVGRPCFFDSPRSNGEVSLQTSTLECVSEVCLQTLAELEPTLGSCTQECISDRDCRVVAEGSRCQSGFVCVIPFVDGSHCCRRLCVCQDGLDISGDDPIPDACDLTNEANTCCNLPGRSDDCA